MGVGSTVVAVNLYRNGIHYHYHYTSFVFGGGLRDHVLPARGKDWRAWARLTAFSGAR